ncbi:hypothetical protein BBJ28_00003942 [Nothophytophthora sp. Chile5]|nr:hypothetical protein BBJ28_00003942 [Nothophytophthora sp. Chile5]
MVVSSNSHAVSASCMAKTYSFVAEETATPTPTTSVTAETTAPSTATDAPVTETTAPVEETTASSVSGSSGSDISIDTTIQATSTIESTYTNWVGPTLGDGSDSACYREAHVMSTCPLGFDYTLETCWAECPLAYPVECGMECILIVDDLIESGTSDNGTYLSAAEYAEKVVDKGLGLFAIWDVTSIAGLVAEFLQTVCGPTEFIGEIDDGTDDDTLGFSTVGDAFNGSTSSWTKAGDGTVAITFTSVDTEDVTVNIMSGGNDYDEVAVAAGETVAWSSNVTDLGGKTLYLDRWRPGFLGLPGTGGGSLLLWVPRSSEGGHLELTATLNVS